MYDVFKVHATDEVKEITGVKIPLRGKSSITVARSQNERYLVKLLEDSELNAEALNTLPKAEAKALDKKIICEVIAETILLDFEDMGYNGKPIEYSKKNAVKLLMHLDFRKLVMTHAANIENFRMEQEAADVKK